MTIFFRPFCGALFYVPLAYVLQKLFFWPCGVPQGPFFGPKLYLEKMNKFLFHFYTVFVMCFKTRFSSLYFLFILYRALTDNFRPTFSLPSKQFSNYEIEGFYSTKNVWTANIELDSSQAKKIDAPIYFLATVQGHFDESMVYLSLNIPDVSKHSLRTSNWKPLAFI